MVQISNYVCILYNVCLEMHYCLTCVLVANQSKSQKENKSLLLFLYCVQIFLFDNVYIKVIVICNQDIYFQSNITVYYFLPKFRHSWYESRNPHTKSMLIFIDYGSHGTVVIASHWAYENNLDLSTLLCITKSIFRSRTPIKPTFSPSRTGYKAQQTNPPPVKTQYSAASNPFKHDKRLFLAAVGAFWPPNKRGGLPLSQ